MSFEQQQLPPRPTGPEMRSDPNLCPSQYSGQTSQPLPILRPPQQQRMAYSASPYGYGPYSVTPNQGSSLPAHVASPAWGPAVGPPAFGSPNFVQPDASQRPRFGSYVEEPGREGPGDSRRHSHHRHHSEHRSSHSRPSYDGERRSSHHHRHHREHEHEHRHGHRHDHEHKTSKESETHRPTLGDTILMMWDSLTGSSWRR